MSAKRVASLRQRSSGATGSPFTALSTSSMIFAMAGTAALLAVRDHDTLAVRREVTSPGGTTARGLAALEAAGVRTAFQEAIDAVLRTGRFAEPERGHQ